MYLENAAEADAVPDDAVLKALVAEAHGSI